MSDFQVEIEQAGRGGTISYRVGSGKRLAFDWEFSTVGVDIFIPTPKQWEALAGQPRKGWLRGRRQEILARVVEEILRQKAPITAVKIEDSWIELRF